MKKILIMIFLMLSFSLILGGCGSKSMDSESQTLTMSELKKYNGQNGKPAYIAVEGVVYDVSSSPLWKGGNHKGYEAGNDLTQEIMESSPHGAGVMKKFPIVGKLID